MLGIRTYRKRKMLQVDIEVQKYRDSFNKEIQDLAMACAKDKGNYEHDYHSAKEKLGIELAKLEALKETHLNDITTYKMLLKEKDEEIKRVNALCLELAKANNVVIQK